MKMLEALKNYQQADEDGVMVLVSRQALDEAICLLGEARKTVWLIEWPEDDNVPVRWWNPATGWMRDANKAMWLARESDATDYIASHKLVSGIKPTEHIFVGIPSIAQAPMRADIAQMIDAGWKTGKSSSEVAEEILREFDASTVSSTQNSPPASLSSLPSGESDPSVTTDCAGGETVSSTPRGAPHE